MDDLEKAIMKIRIQLEKETNKDIRKILLEQKEELEEMRQEVGWLYMVYGENLEMSNIERRNIERKYEKNLKQAHSKSTKWETAIISAMLYKIYKQSYIKTSNTIYTGLDRNIKINHSLTNDKIIQGIVNAKFQGEVFSNRVWDNKDWFVSTIYNIIAKGIYDKYSIDEMSRRISEAFSTNAYNSDRLASTESSRVATMAQDSLYIATGLVDTVVWSAILDDRVCTECSELDGQEFYLLDEGRPMPPLHPFDRCFYVPSVSGWSSRVRSAGEIDIEIDID